MRCILLLPSLLLTVLACQAQRPSRSGLGYAGGPQMATWHSEAVMYRPVPGAAVGLYAPIWAGNRVELQPELLLSLQGYRRDLPDGGSSTLNDLRLAMPFSVKLFLGRIFSLQAGVQGSCLLLARADGKDAREALSPLDMGVHAGLGIGTIGGLDLTLRYYNGLSNLLAEDHALYPSNRTLLFTAGYRFMQFQRGRKRG